MTIDLKIIEDPNKRHEKLLKLRRSIGPYQALFPAHIEGLNGFLGAKVLEIGGGSETTSFIKYFENVGANYEQVTIDPEFYHFPYVRIMDFMDMSQDKYDLILSLGVFESAGIDRVPQTSRMAPTSFDKAFPISKHSNLERLGKLLSITKPGGFNIAGTILERCIFTDAEINASGFELKHRLTPFYTLKKQTEANKEYYSVGDVSELLVMQRPAKAMK